MRFDILTIFPDYFRSPLEVSLLGKAIANGVIEVAVHDLREWADPPHRKVDDEPFGGGAGMVMVPGPIVVAVEDLLEPGGRVLVLSAGGRPLTQALVEDLAGAPQIVLVCGRYEGIDQRVVQVLAADEVSVGEFVLAGGEAASLAVVEAVARLKTGVVGNVESLSEESFSSGLLEYPQYTRPAEFRGISVPAVLASGDHQAVASWRREQALRRTFERRPELLEDAELTQQERRLVERWRSERGVQKPG